MKFSKKWIFSVILVLFISSLLLGAYHKFPVRGIEIRFESDFNRYMCPGKGTQANPYRIENRKIHGYGIEIRSVFSHFIIQNCFIEDGDIEIRSLSSKFVIQNCNINNGRIRIYGTEEYSAKIINCTLENDDTGWSPVLDIIGSDGIIISNNTILSNRRIGDIRSSNIIFSNNYMRDNEGGLSIGERNSLSNTNITFSDNKFINTPWVGLYIENARDIVLRNNHFLNSCLGFERDDMKRDYIYETIIMESNYVDNKPIGFFVGLSNVVLEEEYGQLFLFDCLSVEISNQDITNVFTNIITIGCINVSISNSAFNQTNIYDRDSIFFYQSHMVLLTNVTFVGGEYSFYSLGNDYLYVEDCFFYNQTRYCIYLNSNEEGSITDNFFMFNNTLTMIKNLGPNVIVANNTIITY